MRFQCVAVRFGSYLIRSASTPTGRRGFPPRSGWRSTRLDASGNSWRTPVCRPAGRETATPEAYTSGTASRMPPADGVLTELTRPPHCTHTHIPFSDLEKNKIA